MRRHGRLFARAGKALTASGAAELPDVPGSLACRILRIRHGRAGLLIERGTNILPVGNGLGTKMCRPLWRFTATSIRIRTRRLQGAWTGSVREIRETPERPRVPFVCPGQKEAPETRINTGFPGRWRSFPLFYDIFTHLIFSMFSYHFRRF